MINYDIHIHTHLSSCGARDAFMQDYINAASELGLELMGFADHAWDDSINGASPWYAPQTYKRLIARKEELKTLDKKGINVLLGAEGEYANELLAIGDSAAEFVDYILVPHSHTHMKGFVLPSDCVGNPEKHASYLVKSFISLCNHEKRNMFFGIVHPMSPCGETEEYTEKIFSFITDEMLKECACAASENKVALEVNLSEFKKIPPEQLHQHCYNRFFDACKRAGCEFFMGSDAHAVKAFVDNHGLKNGIVDALGMDESFFKAAKLRISNG